MLKKIFYALYNFIIMLQNKGKIVENAVRRSGYALTKISEKLGISRNTLYNKFANNNLNYDFIIEIGKVIHYDFSVDFPELKEKNTRVNEKKIIIVDKDNDTLKLLRLEKKYSTLLEGYNKLVNFLVKVANENKIYTIKKLLPRKKQQKN